MRSNGLEVNRVNPVKAATSRLCVPSTRLARSAGRRRPNVATRAPNSTRIRIQSSMEPS
ncbi:hypothetical protein D3C86_1794350 [compost metagenome]